MTITAGCLVPELLAFSNRFSWIAPMWIKYWFDICKSSYSVLFTSYTKSHLFQNWCFKSLCVLCVLSNNLAPPCCLCLGVGAASMGKLTFMVGGLKEEYNAAQELLSCMGANVVYCGQVGTGQVKGDAQTLRQTNLQTSSIHFHYSLFLAESRFASM